MNIFGAPQVLFSPLKSVAVSDLVTALDYYTKNLTLVNGFETKLVAIDQANQYGSTIVIDILVSDNQNNKQETHTIKY